MLSSAIHRDPGSLSDTASLEGEGDEPATNLSVVVLSSASVRLCWQSNRLLRRTGSEPGVRGAHAPRFVLLVVAAVRGRVCSEPHCCCGTVGCVSIAVDAAEAAPLMELFQTDVDLVPDSAAESAEGGQQVGYAR